ncbi:hypothetical protein [Fibrobacter sp. UWS1]|uniref:hypothetical protein n=1 Tax=Fibrobacter sp. UWS1 TaxID=1896220 RepID=UPI000BB12D6A|nr:hypothetical protein [Fibrobacter sp. UWS1]PBC67330.1 hypothetical protein BGX14_2981 [Fibrobacter sp. UWS1]
MKKLFWIATFASLAILTSCGKQEKTVFTGYWQGDENMIFEVFQPDPSQNNYTIRNINGDLQAHVEGDSLLTGKNSLEMPFYMRVRGDSAFYQFGTIISTYARIDSATYHKLFQTLTPANP